MKICVVGSYGRDHALRNKFLEEAEEVYFVPGNPAVPGSLLDLSPEDVEADLYVIGPSFYLGDGMADRLRGRGKLVFGPGADGARIEKSKSWMKQIFAEANVPTANWKSFSSGEEHLASAFIRELNGAVAVKFDGAAYGKGVFVTDSVADAELDVREKLSETYRYRRGENPGVVIEQKLVGKEFSLFAICDGKEAFPLAVARDYKRLLNNDEGVNTGGMGAYSPVSDVTPEVINETMSRVVNPIMETLCGKNINYRGILFAGMMLTDNGVYALECNVRLGDPETQVILPRVETGLARAFFEAASGKLLHLPSMSEKVSVTVTMAARGGPTNCKTGDVIYGLENVAQFADTNIYFHSVKIDKQNRLVTDGHRVLHVASSGSSLNIARERAYSAVDKISWKNLHYRTDIARYE